MSMPESKLRLMLEQMMRIRFFEEKVQEVHRRHIPGMVHLYIGEEAVAVGVCANLTTEDSITSTHRGHGHVIAKGADIDRMMAELYARETGLCRGKGGSMHVADASLGILGANGIVGGGITIALGAALASKMKDDSSVSVCFFGDGAANQGSFGESLNLASVWDLPVIYVCENNQYHEFSSSTPVTAGKVAERAHPYGVPGVIVDGMDVRSVYEVAKEAVDRARDGGGPTVIEAETYRFEAHDEGEAALIGTTYRSEEEVSKWKRRDPIAQFKRWLLREGITTEEEIHNLERQVRDEVERSVAFAESSPLPDPNEAYDHVFAE